MLESLPFAGYTGEPRWPPVSRQAIAGPQQKDSQIVTATQAPSRIVIATRESRLALWQAEHVKARIEALYPECRVELLGMTTRGDQILDRPLAKIGGKGLFVKELESALFDRSADIAVHSMKDVPMVLPPGFALIATAAREVPLDAFVSNKYASLDDLPPGGVVGTSSLRREAQIHAQYPYLSVASLRGNLDTRLRKLDAGDYDAIILAAAGLTRLGLAARIRATLPAEASLPAAGQGALGIEALADRSDLAAWLAPLELQARGIDQGVDRTLLPLARTKRRHLHRHRQRLRHQTQQAVEQEEAADQQHREQIQRQLDPPRIGDDQHVAVVVTRRDRQPGRDRKQHHQPDQRTH